MSAMYSTVAWAKASPDSKFEKIKIERNVAGDKVGVGCISDSCMNCDMCTDGEEHMCDNGMTGTYDGKIKHGHLKTDKGWTYGGYSASQTVHQKFIVKVPAGYPLEAAGPIFCAGVTMYSPLCNWGVKSGGKRVGIIGIGVPP